MIFSIKLFFFFYALDSAVAMLRKQVKVQGFWVLGLGFKGESGKTEAEKLGR
jgi:hypothetical protein